MSLGYNQQFDRWEGPSVGLNAPALKEEALAVPLAAGALVPPAGAKQLMVQVTGGAVRYRTKGAATATAGTLVSDGREFYSGSAEWAGLNVVTVSGTPALWAVWS
jgi:hypothetical protein